MHLIYRKPESKQNFEKISILSSPRDKEEYYQKDTIGNEHQSEKASHYSTKTRTNFKSYLKVYIVLIWLHIRMYLQCTHRISFISIPFQEGREIGRRKNIWFNLCLFISVCRNFIQRDRGAPRECLKEVAARRVRRTPRTPEKFSTKFSKTN